MVHAVGCNPSDGGSIPSRHSNFMKTKVAKITDWLLDEDTIGISGAILGVIAWIFFWEYLLILAGGALVVLGILRAVGCD